MSNKSNKYALDWMPSLLRLCMEIQAHTETLNEAKVILEERINKAERDLKKIRGLSQEISSAQHDASQRQIETDQAEAKYTTYREGIMSRLMDAARAGESIDREEAGRLIELEIDRNLRAEQVKQASSRVEELRISRANIVSETETKFTNCQEVDSLLLSYDAAAQHLSDIRQILEDLCIEKSAVDEQNPENALNSFIMVVESYSAWINCVRAEASTGATIEKQRQHLMKVHDISPINSSTLFSEICIAGATTHGNNRRLKIPDQEPYTGDMTEY
jgi:vacuolar-type H+-ATPase subunit I/STV1